MTILVTGGAGYIGSVTVERLATNGESIVVLDDLSYGHREAIDADIPFYQGAAGDRGLLARIVKEHGIDSCIHFAASAFVAESVEKPALYFENNVQQGISLLNALVEAGVRRFIFSSSCTVYGEVTRIPIGEDSPLWPKNPYGWTKFTLERILETYDTAYGLKSICLRYFNAAGATERFGEDHAGARGAGDGDCVGGRRAAAEVDRFLSEAAERRNDFQNRRAHRHSVSVGTRRNNEALTHGSLGVTSTYTKYTKFTPVLVRFRYLLSFQWGWNLRPPTPCTSHIRDRIDGRGIGPKDRYHRSPPICGFVFAYRGQPRE
jgi:nucleoside-diphosphate-sugar epimerase